MRKFDTLEAQYLEPPDDDDCLEYCEECGEELIDDECMNEDCDKFWEDI